MHSHLIAQQYHAHQLAAVADHWLTPEARAYLDALTPDQMAAAIDDVLRPPIAHTQPHARTLHGFIFAAATWHYLHLLAAPRSLRGLEMASGSTSLVPRMIDLYTAGTGSYATANLNQLLTAEFRRRTADLRIPVTIIEADGTTLAAHFPPASFDLAFFEHAFNDTIQTIVAHQVGIDTVHSNWWDISPAMVQATNDLYHAGQLDAAARQPFIDLISATVTLLQPGGTLAFNHCVFKTDRDYGNDPALYDNYCHLGRRWLTESDLPVTELPLADFDPQWWLFLRKQ